jgi:hypothetical protein
MRRLATLIGLTLLLIVTLVANANSRTPPSPSPLDAEYAPGRLLARFADERAPAALVEALAPFAATVAAEIAPLGVYRLNVPIGQELTAAERLRQRPDVLYAEPDYIWPFASRRRSPRPRRLRRSFLPPQRPPLRRRRRSPCPTATSNRAGRSGRSSPRTAGPSSSTKAPTPPICRSRRTAASGPPGSAATTTRLRTSSRP